MQRRYGIVIKDIVEHQKKAMQYKQELTKKGMNIVGMVLMS